MLLTETAVTGGVVDIPRFTLEHGGELHNVRIAYQVYGTSDLPAIVVLGGISSSRNISPGWWQDFVGPDRAVDTTRFRIIGIDFLGGCGASTQANTESFPTITTADQANAICAVLDTLGITRLHAFIGSSYGGMVALAFGERHPNRVSRLIVIGAAHEAHPMATALRGLQRRTVRLGLSTGRVHEAVAIARGIAMTTYRTATEFTERFDVKPKRVGDRWRQPVEDYIEARGEEFANRFPAAAFLCLSQSSDLHSVDPSRIRVPATLIAIDSDSLVPLWQMQELAARIAGDVELHTIPSLYGHDGFLKEVDAISSILQTTLSQEAES